MQTIDEQSNLREYVQIFWARRRVVIFAVVAAVVLSLAYSTLTTSTYQGTADLLLEPQLPSTVQQANNAFYPQITVDVPTDIQIIESASVANIVKQSVPNAPSATATQIGTTNVVAVSVQSSDRALAATAATAYANAYIQLENHQTASALQAASKTLQQRLTSIQASINSVSRQISSVGAASPGVETQLAAVQGALQNEQSTLQNQLSTYQSYATNQALESGQVLTPAPEPSSPVKPKLVEYALLAGILGLVVGLGAVLALEFLQGGTIGDRDRHRTAGPSRGVAVPVNGDHADPVGAHGTHGA